MAEAERPPRPAPRLLTWSLGSFHTALFVAVLIALVYRGGGLGNLLGGLSTGLGFALYAALWLSTWWCTRRALRASWETWASGRVDPEETIARSLRWGAATGGLFLGTLVALVAVPWLAVPLLLIATVLFPRWSGPWPRRASVLVDWIAFTIGVLLLGLPLLIGAVVGLILALVDSLLFDVSLYLLQITIHGSAADGL